MVAAAFAVGVGACALRWGLGRVDPVDYHEYLIAGHRLAQTGSFLSPLIVKEGAAPTPSALLPPLYVAIVAEALDLLGSDSGAWGGDFTGGWPPLGVQSPAGEPPPFLWPLLALQLLNALAHAGIVLFVWDCAWRLGAGPWAWVVALLTSFNPIILGFVPLVWDTSLTTLGVAASAWLAVVLGDRPRGPAAWLGYGLWLGALALLNPGLTLAYPVLVLWPLCRAHGERGGRHGSASSPGRDDGKSGRHWRPIAARLGLSLLGWAAAIAPWTVRNTLTFHEIFYVRNGFGHQLWLGVCPEMDGTGEGVFRTWYPLKNARQQEYIANIGEQAYLRIFAEKAWAAVRENPWRYARLVAWRLSDYGSGTVFTHRRAGESGWPKSWRRWVTLLFSSSTLAAALAAGIAAAFIGRGGGRKTGARRAPIVLLLMAALFAVPYVLTHVEARYRAPVEPLLAMAIAGGMALLRRKHEKGGLAESVSSSGPGKRPCWPGF